MTRGRGTTQQSRVKHPPAPYERAALAESTRRGAPTCCGVVALTTRRFSQNRARPAASRSQATATQNTGIQDPPISTSFAAPQPAKIEAVPLAVYWIP